MGLFLYMWRSVNKSVPRAIAERRNISTYVVVNLLTPLINLLTTFTRTLVAHVFSSPSLVL
jgi:hypothetical protein